eukprot:gene4595-14786_t
MVVAEKVAMADSPLLNNIQFLNSDFYDVSNEKEFFVVIQKQVDAGLFPKQLLPVLQDFYNNYKKAILGSDQAGANEKLVAQIQATIADLVMGQLKAPYVFPSKHERILEPYDYFAFGQRYTAGLINFNKSLLGHPERWDVVDALLKKGENVILLANHQTEADPGAFAHMLMATHPEMAQNVIYVAGDRVVTDALCKPFSMGHNLLLIYVAGDRVVTDALCKPFSMGRNLFCVHSRKHINDDPALFEAKSATNLKTLNAGGALLWIAPSGGRDRPKDGHWSPDPFDPSSVGLMYNLASRSKSPCHMVPMAMYSYEIMPPPPALEKNLGERRLTNHAPVGITLGVELDLTLAEGQGKEAKAAELTEKAFTDCCEEYAALEAAIKDESKRGELYTQPWLKAVQPVSA